MYMRLLATVLLLLQLQPLVGLALCFDRGRPAKAECVMPDTGPLAAPAERTLTPTGTSQTTGCVAAEYCARTVPAIPKFAESLQITPVVHGAPAPMDAVLALGDPLAPPFHPPKA